MFVSSRFLTKQAWLLALGFPLAWHQARVATAQSVSSTDLSKPDITLHGVVLGSQNHSYIEVPFHVPSGVHRVTITFSYTGREQKTALDLGLEDPSELRCWSGGNKSTLTVGLADATPSCLPGPIPAGEWNILIGVPNIRAHVTAHYTATVFLSRSGLVSDEPAILREPLRSGPAWYRGDLHMHTAHSDGHCPNQSGQMVPCPVFMTVEAAERRGLDFIAITDHNAMSQYDAMRELQPYFNNVLLIPGREITTFQGHINFLGTTDFLDFRVGSKAVPTLDVLLQNAQRLGALLSINHPNAPGGEICMGCRWTPESPVQMHYFTGIEAVNGGGEDPAESGIPFWQEQLNLGHRLTAIGGSDNHQPLLPPDATNAVGHPTTVVYARDLSTPAILEGIRSGRVFIDVAGTRNRMLDMSGHTSSASAVMGGLLDAKAGEQIAVDVRIDGCDGDSAQLVEGGGTSAPAQTIHGDHASLHWTVTAGSSRSWFLLEVHDASGQVALVGNPIYVNWVTAGNAR
ncbi:MAG TPA: CehA/McbA family metallohydrolase [Acidobacteriaceae bacterium]|nr:CehA/McbA family metallohydrolase [Acidobacteriaceae bacterium]